MFKKNTLMIRLLNGIELAGNRLPSPFLIFCWLSLLIVIASAILDYYDVYVTLNSHHAHSQIISVKSLLDREGLLFMLNSVITNFTGFFPLGTVFVMMLCIGIAEGSGLIRAVIIYLVSITPKQLITAMIVFLGICANIASSAGYVVLIPLGALVFLGFQRHPVAGIAAAFAGVSGGWSANLLIGTNDAIFAGISTEAARFIQPDYLVTPISNWYFMAASTLLITFIGTWVTEKIVEPRLGIYHGDAINTAPLSKQEKRGLYAAGVGLLLYLLMIILLAIPSNSILRHPETQMLAGGALLKNLVIWIALGFAWVGFIFGRVTATITDSHTLATMMTQSIQQLSGFLVLIFFAAQFIAYFNYSNLGIILAINGASLFQSLGLNGIFLIIALVLFTAMLNLLMAVDSAKWVMIAPIFVPMFMQLGLSPELTQAAYRIGDSATNVIAPTMPFFPLIVALCQKYNPKLGIGSLVAIMLPYSVLFLIAWIILLILWYLCGFALGPNVSLFYQ